MISLIIPYFNQPQMLARHLAEWAKYPDGFRFVIVDDCSDVPAFPVVYREECPENLALYRIDTPIDWNRGGARNLAARESLTPWLLMLDIDHVLTADNAARLLAYFPLRNTNVWYRFPRERIGRADETRRKDAIPDDCERGPIHPHIDSYLVGRAAYWQAGGYNESFSGCLGGGTPFLAEMVKEFGEPQLLDDVTLQVHTRHSVPDANTPGLSRDLTEFHTRLRRLREAGTVRGHAPYCRFEWRRVL